MTLLKSIFEKLACKVGRHKWHVAEVSPNGKSMVMGNLFYKPRCARCGVTCGKVKKITLYP